MVRFEGVGRISWRDRWSEKFTAPEKAVKDVKSGDVVVLANLCAEPHVLPARLMDRAEELTGVKLFHLRPFGEFKERYLEREMEKRIRCVTAFAGGVKPIVQLIREGRADFYPIPLSKIPWLLKSGTLKPDVFMLTVSPPDERGYCSLGVSVDYALAALQSTETVMAEVNENMPQTCGDTFVHLSELDYLVEVSAPVYELPSADIGSIERRIGENVASLVEDEATIQIGYGGLAEAVTLFLKEKRNLGMHTEMIPEGAVTLVEQGALTCQKKSVHKGKIVGAFAAGTERLYDWLDGNPMIEMKPFEYTNDSTVVAMNHKMTAINTALQVDLYGNIYSDMLGLDQYSGAGGQPDFVSGAFFCPTGKSIIVLPSAAASGEISRIVVHPSLADNARAPLMPTAPRFYADYVVTEWGAASLKDKTTRERAKALIEISHPNFKDYLWKKAATLKLVD